MIGTMYIFINNSLENENKFELKSQFLQAIADDR